MKKPSWPWKAGRHDKEASSSRAPPPSDAVRRAEARREELRAARNARRRARRARVSTEVAQIYWDVAAPLPWSDVHLPDGWHLSHRRIPVPAIPRSGRARTEEILRRRSFLPPDLVHDPAYAINSPLWDRWFEVEHDARRRAAFAAEAPAGYQPAPPDLVELEDDDSSDFDWSGDEDTAAAVKMEEDQLAPPAYDEEAAF